MVLVLQTASLFLGATLFMGFLYLVAAATGWPQVAVAKRA